MNDAHDVYDFFLNSINNAIIFINQLPVFAMQKDIFGNKLMPFRQDF